MGFLKEVASAWSYRRKDSVTPDEFIEAFRDDSGREMDPESVIFFRCHPDTVNILHKILTGKLKLSGNRKKDRLVIDFVVAEVTFSLPTKPPESLVDVMEKFSETYKDAGMIIENAFMMFWGK